MTLHCWNGQKWNPSGSGTMQSKCAQQRRTLTFFWKSDSMAPAMIIFMTEHWRYVENYLTRKKGKKKNHIMFSSNELSYIFSRGFWIKTLQLDLGFTLKSKFQYFMESRFTSILFSEFPFTPDSCYLLFQQFHVK